MRVVAWLLVIAVSVLSILMVAVSITSPAIQLAGLGAGLTALVVSVLGVAMALDRLGGSWDAFKARRREERVERYARGEA